jgi:hypothetical protein
MEVQVVPSSDHDQPRQRERGGGGVGGSSMRHISTDTLGDKCQARSLPEPQVPHQAQAQRLRHDEELHDLGVPSLGVWSSMKTRSGAIQHFSLGKT